jgi:hypothetical protein
MIYIIYSYQVVDRFDFFSSDPGLPTWFRHSISPISLPLRGDP